MFSYASYALRRVRSIGQAWFLRFGLHCATHQIRVILISGVVITSLSYPALALYSSSQPKSLSFIDSFIPPQTLTGLSAQDDLDNLWSIHNTLRVHEDAVSRAKCGVGRRALRVERVFIQSPIIGDDDSALNHRILLSTLQLEKKIESALSTSEPCLRVPEGHCLVLSPLLFWNYDAEALSSDPNILDTLSLSSNVTVNGIPITPQMVLTGRGSTEHVAGSKFDYATFLSLTYFFPQSDCIGNVEHSSWLQTLQKAAEPHSVLAFVDEEPTLIALEYNPSQSKRDSWSPISAFLYVAYAGFFAYISWSMRYMDKVHSRVGVTFTALVEIAASTVTSLSVCALVGFKVTMVPWELLPIVIVFVGAENMFNLVDAVGKTHVTLSVKQRIAEGLSYAGTSNTLKVVCYNIILGIIAVFSVGAIKQFCTFAIVVLVAHWFLAHTFFIAVLSIDIQRLELDELLRQNSDLAPAVPRPSKEANTKPPKSRWRRLVVATQNLLKSRATANLSLLMLLAITATLYYTTYTASSSEHILPHDRHPGSHHTRSGLARTKTSSGHKAVPTSFGAVSRPKSSNATQIIGDKPPSMLLWETLNPNQAPLLHVRLEMPTVITLNLDVDESGHQDHPAGAHHERYPFHSRDKSTMRRTWQLLEWFFKVMVLPIGATTLALWGLCLYLLKDADLLEAQRNKPEKGDDLNSGSVNGKSGKGLGKRRSGLLRSGADDDDDNEVAVKNVVFETLPRALNCDVEWMKSSRDGKVMVCVGVDDEVVLWKEESRVKDKGKRKGSYVTVNVADEILGVGSSRMGWSRTFASPRTPTQSTNPAFGKVTLTALAIDGSGKYFAVGTKSGVVVVWEVDGVGVRPIGYCSGPAGVLDIQFGSTSPTSGNNSLNASPSKAPPAASQSKQSTTAPWIVVGYDDGQVIKWKEFVEGFVPRDEEIRPSSEEADVQSSHLLRVFQDDRILVAFCMKDGSVELVDVQASDPLLLMDVVIRPTPSIPTPSSSSNTLDPITHLHACRAEINGSMRLILTLATSKGLLSVWDIHPGASSECITQLYIEDSSAIPSASSLTSLLKNNNRIRQIRVTPVSCEACRTCGEMPNESLAIAVEGTDSVVQCWRIVVWSDESLLMMKRRCECYDAGNVAAATAAGMGIGMSSMGMAVRHGMVVGTTHERSRSNSANGSPLIPRMRLVSGSATAAIQASSSPGVISASSTSSASGPASYPISGHGVHSRRATEKEGGRRSFENMLNIPPPFAGAEDGSELGLSSASTSIWKRATLSCVMMAEVERGGWDVSRGRVIGISRRSSGSSKRDGAFSSHGNASRSGGGTQRSGIGLTQATLERWELWSFDPSTTVLERSVLAGLVPRREKNQLQQKQQRQQQGQDEDIMGRLSISSNTSTSSALSNSSMLSSMTSKSGMSTSTSSTHWSVREREVPRLPFTRVSPVLTTPSCALVGFGNTIGVFEFDQPNS
ncbi:hypothetical protein AX16_002891 [Volvariella volvacea WC 439]|nr:hypothetical protein AX16_002891 [Volvariella volvacea WC 439]